MANLVENTKLEDLQKRISALESGNTSRLVNVSSYNTPPAPVLKPEVKKPAAVNQRIDNVEQTAAPSVKSTAGASEEEVLNQPVPMSKPASSNNLKTIWVKLLENISSFPSRAILKQQALPIKIAQDEVIISIKNPSWLKQFGPDGAKHNFIVEAANSLFAGSSPKVIVRAPAPGDDAIRAGQSNSAGDGDDDKPAPAPAKSSVIAQEKSLNVKKDDSGSVQLNKKQISNESMQTEQKVADVPLEKPKISTNPDSSYHSDNVNMVMDLFDGKLID